MIFDCIPFEILFLLLKPIWLSLYSMSFSPFGVCFILVVWSDSGRILRSIGIICYIIFVTKYLMYISKILFLLLKTIWVSLRSLSFFSFGVWLALGFEIFFLFLKTILNALGRLGFFSFGVHIILGVLPDFQSDLDWSDSGRSCTRLQGREAATNYNNLIFI